MASRFARSSNRGGPTATATAAAAQTPAAGSNSNNMPFGPPVTQDVPQTPIYVDTQHEDMVHDAQLDFYGSKLATCSSDRTIKIYNVGENNYELAATLTGAEGPVWQVSWCHPMFGVILAACSFDGSVILYRETRPRDWSILYSAKNLHQSSVNSLCFAPPEWGLMVAAASSDGKVSILSLQDDNSWSVEYINDNPLGVNSVSWSPSGAYSLTGTESESGGSDGVDADGGAEGSSGASEQSRLVTGGCDNQIRFWVQQSETGEWVEDQSNTVSTHGSASASHGDWVRDVAWAPVILPDVNMVASCSEDGTVIVWSQNGKGEPWTGHLLHTFPGPVWRVSWSETGHILAVSSGDADVVLFKKGLDGVWHQMDTLKDEAPESAQQ